MKRLVLAFCLLALTVASSHAGPWEAPSGHAQVPIWRGVIPDAVPAKPESAMATTNLVAGKPWVAVLSVSTPTMTIFPPLGANTGAAVVVFPGGGYKILAIDLEGTEVCEWLASHGITGILLKYRVPNGGPHWNPDTHREEDPKAPTALEDAQRTVGLVRSRAAELHVDPHKIGVLGFSAGGHLIADVSTHWKKRAYRPVDAADSVSCRPDFAVGLYPGHLLEHSTGPYELNPQIPVTRETPPTFLVQAMDDPVDPVRNSMVYQWALSKAGVPVELHLFARGGHAFGLRRTPAPITRWPDLMLDWLISIGVITAETAR